ncbi:ABC transporter substrate-binding protein [Methylopila musalis]|uniref:ABC transporter substrate-binding protein n=1 Tax=Methylopila musalis TaxID=1134781 RepID=A0ABW3Z6N2_9HYPH
MSFNRIKAALAAAAMMFAATGDADAKLRIAWQTGDVQVILQYAEGAGLFKEAGLDYSLHAFPAGPAILSPLAAKEVDIAWLGEFPVVTGFANKIPFSLFLVDQSFTESVRLVANPKAGVKEIKDLKGKKIGVTFGSTGHNHILIALKSAGLTASDVTLVNLAPAQLPPAYAAGQIDAAFTWEPNIAKLEEQGGVRIATSASIGTFAYGLWVGRNETLTNDAADIQKFLAVWDKAVAKLKSDPDEVLKYEAKRLDQSADQIKALVDRQKVERPSFEQQLTPAWLGAPGDKAHAKFVEQAKEIGAFLVSLERIKEQPADWTAIIDQQPLIDYLKSKKS